jgi:hypothetical protein
MAANEADKALTKIARSAFVKKGIDLGIADFRVMNGVLYVRGTVSTLPGVSIPNLKQELESLALALRPKGIRDAILDCAFRGR